MAAMTERAVLILASIAIFLCLTTSTNGQSFSGRARLFIADNSPSSPSIAVVDLPSYNLSQRVALPGTSLQFGVSHTNAHIGIFRNRDNGHQFFSVASTGILPAVPAAGPKLPSPPSLKDGQIGVMRSAFLMKSLILVNGSDAIGGVEAGRSLVYHQGWKQYLMYAENHGKVFTYDVGSLDAPAAFKPKATFSLPVGHFHVLPYGSNIISPHTGVSKAFILDSKGRVVREYPCIACHGAATYVAQGGAMTAVFGCNTTVLVVRGTSVNATHIPVSNPRVGSFVNGVPGVFWSSTSTQLFFWRTDVRSTVPRVTSVPHRGGLIRIISLPTVGRFVAVHSDGNLVLYDGDSGAALASVLLRQGGFPATQTAPFLQSDARDEHVFVAVPALGVVHVVDVDHGGHDDHNHAPGEEVNDAEPPSMTLARSLTVGGMPTSMTLAYMPGVRSY